MARNRASMREGPLAELFRATEASKRGGQDDAHEQQQLTTEPEPGTKASEPDPPEPTPLRVAEPARVPQQPEPAELPEPAAARPPTRWLDPLPESPARLERARDSTSYLAVIRVVGVGGAGLNAVDRMIDAGITQVDFVAVNTDIQQLQMCDAPTKIHIGSELTEGLGSGADPEIGRHAAEDGYDSIKRTLRGSDMVFVTAGEGGGTGSGAAPIVARIAREVGALTVGIVTMPFKFEGTRRRKQAEDGVAALREACDTLIVIPNDRLLEVLDRSTSMLDAFRIADDVLRHGVQGICDLITNPGLINLDFADVRTVMKDSGTALMGIGYATGEGRAKEAAERALRSPLIETEITGARGILLSIAGGDDLTLFEVNEAAEAVRESATDDTNIIFGATIDDRLTGQMWITVVATGIGGGSKQSRRGTFVTAASGGSGEIFEPPSFLRDEL
ncbi:MAG TPA: cell division protein FtsZ [Gaiellaceae bacterium]|nr:cell division protein FtsZ [Gaiellaceae bacterium]